MTVPTKRTALLAAAAVALGLASPAAAAEYGGPQTRVAVADGASGAVRIFDVRNGRQLARLRVAGPASLSTLDDGRHLLATQSEADRVDAIDGGAWVVDHGDHFHYFAVRPRLLPFRLRVPRPVHVVPHGRQVAIFADGSGEAHVIDLPALRRPAGDRIRLATGKPHHGVAVPLGERFAATESQGGELPNAVTLRDAAGATLGRFDGCPSLHGETAGNGWAAFACEDGVLLVLADGTGTAQKLPYPPRANAEQRAWTLSVDRAARWLVGDFGERALFVFEHASWSGRAVPVNGHIASFAMEPRSGAVLVLTTDGRLRRVDPASGRQVAARRVIPRRFKATFEAPSPKLAVAGGWAAVSDPKRHTVTMLRLRGLRPARTLRVPGRPTSLTLAGAK